MVSKVVSRVQKAAVQKLVPKYPDKPLSSSRLIVSDDVSFVWLGETITKQEIDEQFEEWRGYAIMAGIGREWRGQLHTSLLAVMYEETPFTLTTTPGTTFEVQFQSFPYTINGKDHFQEYSLRLVPLTGEVIGVEMREDASVAINLFKMQPEQLLADTGNGSLHFELYFKPAKVKTPLVPCQGFSSSVGLPTQH